MLIYYKCGNNRMKEGMDFNMKIIKRDGRAVDYDREK